MKPPLLLAMITSPFSSRQPPNPAFQATRYTSAPVATGVYARLNFTLEGL